MIILITSLVLVPVLTDCCSLRSKTRHARRGLQPACKQLQACEGTSKKREGILYFFKFSFSHNTSMQVCEFVNCDQGWVAVSIVQCHDTDALELDPLSSFQFWAFLDIFMQYGAILPSPSSRPLQLD